MTISPTATAPQLAGELSRHLARLARASLALGLAGFLAAPFGVPTVASAQQSTTPAIPEPLLPDLQVLPPSGLYIVPASDEDEKRLKFTTTIWNAGPGILEVRGSENPTTGELMVLQVLFGEGGLEMPGGMVGTFNFEHRHGHLHLSDFARYELWSLTEDGSLDELVAVNEKVGFCLMDNVLIDPDATLDDDGPRYSLNCDGDVQGISPGYGDIYVAQLYEQDLVITDLPDGRYALVNIANPDGTIIEATLENNRSMVYVVLQGNEARVDD